MVLGTQHLPGDYVGADWKGRDRSRRLGAAVQGPGERHWGWSEASGEGGGSHSRDRPCIMEESTGLGVQQARCKGQLWYFPGV